MIIKRLSLKWLAVLCHYQWKLTSQVPHQELTQHTHTKHINVEACKLIKEMEVKSNMQNYDQTIVKNFYEKKFTFFGYPFTIESGHKVLLINKVIKLILLEISWLDKNVSLLTLASQWANLHLKQDSLHKIDKVKSIL